LRYPKNKASGYQNFYRVVVSYEEAGTLPVVHRLYLEELETKEIQKLKLNQQNKNKLKYLQFSIINFSSKEGNSPGQLTQGT